MGYAMPAPPVPAPAPPAPTSRRIPLVVAGVVLALVGVALFVMGGMRLRDGVESLAPAPGGCESVLEFDGDGTYTFFVETRGELDALDGNCAGVDREYDYDGDALPRVSLTLVDESGGEVDLDRVDGPTYDAAGRSGTAVRTAELEAGGVYTLTVDTNEADLVVRVGRDPNRGVALMRTSGIAVAAVGLLGAVAALVFLRRRGGTPPPVAVAGPASQWQPGQGPPPVAPPNAAKPIHPPYGAGQPGYGGQWGTPPPSSYPPPPPPGR